MTFSPARDGGTTARADPAGLAPPTGQGSALDPLIADFLAWLAPGPRPYHDVMDLWRTSCPRLTVWEDALDGGLVVRTRAPGEEPHVSVTPLGRRFLASRAPRP